MGKHWRIDDLAWDRFDPSLVDRDLIPLVKAASVVERNGSDYATYLCNVFADDPDFSAAALAWAVEECQHGDALGRWAMLADPSWDYPDAFARYRAGYRLPLEIDSSVRGSRTGELIARCMVETGTSSFYTALAERTREPVLALVCKQIAADEYRHFKLFYDHMRRYLSRERIGVLRRARIALGRVAETEDDELAFAFHVTNESPDLAYDHARCTSLYMSRAMGCYRRPHLVRAMGMTFKTIGFVPHTRLADAATSLAWATLRRRHRRFVRAVSNVPPRPIGRAIEAVAAE